jgi:S-(hydroxymethyl)glutathione dehydrogenase/alcohol dehydrogenase
VVGVILAQAAVWRDGGFAVRAVELDDPRENEVVVEVSAVGLCASDIHALRVMDGPALAGHEFTGRVVHVGEGVSDLAAGTEVVGCLTRFCGDCSECVAGKPTLCLSADSLLRPGRIRLAGEEVQQVWGLGAFASHVVVHRNQLVRLTRHVPAEQAALLGCSVLTGIGTVQSVLAVTPGASVVVFGAGGVGLAAIEGARLAGAAPIVAVDVAPEALAAAGRHGATTLVDGRGGDTVALVREASGGGADFAIEASGVAANVAAAVASTRDGGTTALVGLHPAGTTVSIDPVGDLILRQRALVGVSMGGSDPRALIPQLADLVAAGELHLDIADRIDLHGIAAAYEGSRASSGRVVVTRFASAQ